MLDFLGKIALVIFIAAMADVSAQTMSAIVVGTIIYKLISLIWEHYK